MSETGDPLSPFREEHIQEATKARWVEQIEEHFSAGEYKVAEQAVADALAAFPGDREIAGLALLAEEALRRATGAKTLLESAEAKLAKDDFEGALVALRQAERLDERNPEVRTSLVGALVGQARLRAATDRQEAESLLNEALKLDSNNPAARRLATLLEGVRPEISHQSSQPAVEKLAVPVTEKPPVPVAEDKQPASVALAQPASATVVLSADVVGELPELPTPNPELPAEADDKIRSSASPASRKRTPLAWLAAVVVVVAIAGFLVYQFGFRQHTPTVLAVLLSANAPGATFTVDGRPAGASLRLKLGPHTAVAEAAGYIPDTQSFVLSAQSAQPLKIAFALKPVLPELRISSGLKAGTLTIDNGSPVDLIDGGATENDIQPGDHTLKIFDGKKELISIAFHTQQRGLPSLTAPLPDRGTRAVVIASLGDSAKVYASPGIRAAAGDGPLQPVAPSGLDLTGIGSARASLTVADGNGKPRALPLEASAWPVVNVILNGAPERIPFTVTANVADAQILVDGTLLKNPMVNGSRIIALPPGKYTIQVEHQGYTSPAGQVIEIKPGESKVAPLAFTLTPVVQYAKLSVSGAPPQTEVWVDQKRVGEIDGSGAFTGKIPSGTHSVSLRKPNFERVSVTQDFKPNEVVRMNGSAVRPYGTIKLHVTPANAKITYLREGASEPSVEPADQAVPLPQGIYRVVAEADQYISKSATVKVVPGAAVAYDWTLKPVPTPRVALTPALTFENGGEWTMKAGWWVHYTDGFSFLKERQGTFTIDILRQVQKSFLHSRGKKVSFVADYRDGDNLIAYTLEGRNLTRRILQHGHAQQSKRILLESEPAAVYRFVVNLAADSVTIKDGSGKTLDAVKTSGPMGKFGFDGPVALVVR